MWRWTNFEKSRYYQAELVKDLFGDWTLIMYWGGLGSRRGQARADRALLRRRPRANRGK
jgi:hypothetical protein